MVRYILTKIDDSVIKDKRFFNGKTKKFFGNKSVVLTEDELWNLKGLVVFFLNSINVQQKPEFTIRIINKKLDKVLK